MRYNRYISRISVIIFLIVTYCFLSYNVAAYANSNNNTLIKLGNQASTLQNLSSDKKNENIVNINIEGINNFSNVKYIENANYFKANPYHHINDGSDNKGGTCTTVAMQLLMGYHNYYSDRRLIPKYGENGIRFLSDDYGEITEHPSIKYTTGRGQGRTSIGTEPGLYEEIFNLTWISEWYGLGQAVGLVKDGAVRFINKYAIDIADEVTITSGFFSKSTAKEDIDSNKPIILGFSPLFSGATSFHVVPVYGYATLDGVEGFIAHYGWGDVNTHVWIPASWFLFQIRMSVNHTHNFIDTEQNVNNTHRKLNCTTCGSEILDNLYEMSTDGKAIVGINYTLIGNIVIPSRINEKMIYSIDENVFKNQNRLCQIYIPYSVTNIGINAFENCTSLESVVLSNNLVSIEYSTFKNCSSLKSISIPNTVKYISASAFENCATLERVTLSSGLETIGDLSFKNCSSLESIIIPNTVIIIFPNAFENCSSLQEVTLSNNLTSLSNSVFKNCSNLTEITIPSNIKNIKDEAFKDCTSLEHVNVLRKIDGITDLGVNVFDGCSSNLQIIVSQDRVAEYKNKVNWDSYKFKVIPDNNVFDEIDLHCYSDKDVLTTLESKYKKIYQLNIECGKSYKITSLANNQVIVNLYNSNMELLETSNNVISRYLGSGTYYIDLEFSNQSSGGNITTMYELTWPINSNRVNYGTNNILDHLHKVNDQQKQNNLSYDNTQGPGFYEIKLTSNLINYPEGCIKVYNDSSKTNLLENIPLTNFSDDAISVDNRLLVYLPNNKVYYIDIELPNDEYSSMNLSITKEEDFNLDLSESLTESSFNELFLTNQSGNYFKKVIISHRCSLKLDALTYKAISTNIPVVIFKQLHNNNTNEYYLNCVLLEEISTTNRCPEFNFILDEGTYYFGYLDNIDSMQISYGLERVVNTEVDINGTLVSDPAMNQGYELGSEVNFNNGICNDYTITEGFTRNIYLMVEDRLLQPMSRLDYDWYSSNENVAIVTNYGTLLAKNVNANTEVTIYAILKEDPSVVYKRTFTILNDTSTESIEITCNMSYSYSSENGTYQLELDNSNSPFPMIQYYNWQVDVTSQDNELEVALDYWGHVTSTGVGSATITGTYMFNSRVKVIINLIITE